jgi:hypothetical protein
VVLDGEREDVKKSKRWLERENKRP